MSLRLGKFLGKGTFCRVYASINENTVYKIYSDADRFCKDLYFLRKMNHPHIPNCRGYGLYGRGYYIQMDMYQPFIHKDLVSDPKIHQQLLSAIVYLHANSVIHGDIKPDNLLFKDGDVFLTDFNTGSHFEVGGVYTGAQVTVNYRAPELMKETFVHDYSADIWALGCTLYELVTGKLLFHGYTVAEVETEIMKEWSFEGVNEDLNRILRKMIVKDPSQRATARELLLDPYFRDLSNSYFRDLSDSYFKDLNEPFEKTSLVDWVTPVTIPPLIELDFTKILRFSHEHQLGLDIVGRIIWNYLRIKEKDASFLDNLLEVYSGRNNPAFIEKLDFTLYEVSPICLQNIDSTEDTYLMLSLYPLIDNVTEFLDTYFSLRGTPEGIEKAHLFRSKILQ